MENNFFEKYIHEGKCLPQEAACLIKGIDPDECSMLDGEPAYDEINQYKTAYIRIIDEELQCLVDVLCGGSSKWWLYRNKNIFAHLNTALKNNITIVPELMIEIKKIYSNYLSHDKAGFNKLHPYLVREFSNVPSTETEDEITTEVKYAFWYQTALRIYSDNPNLPKKELVRLLISDLRQKNPAYLKTIDGTEHDPLAIERQIKLRDIKKQIAFQNKS